MLLPTTLYTLKLLPFFSSNKKDYRVFNFMNGRTEPDSVHEAPSGEDLTLVIDNGCFACRAGWACEKEPRMQFKNVMAKNRGSRSKAGDWDTQIGNDIKNIEVVRWLLKTQFDRNVVVNFEVQEQIFDHIFHHLGITSENCVPHPLVLTEAVCNPSHCRHLMSELLFECYHVPRVAYGIDALFSLHHNTGGTPGDALVVSAGFHTTHVLPVIDGRLDAQHCKRINVGGAHSTAYLQRLLQLKHPALLSGITLSRVEKLAQHHCYVAHDYVAELECWHDSAYSEANTRVIQLPCASRSGLGAAGTVVASPASMTVAASSLCDDRKQQQLRRLQELNARRRVERLQADTHKLQTLRKVQEMEVRGNSEQLGQALSSLGLRSIAELHLNIERLQAAMDTRSHNVQSDDSLEPRPDEERGMEQEKAEWLQKLRRERGMLLERLKNRHKNSAHKAEKLHKQNEPYIKEEEDDDDEGMIGHLESIESDSEEDPEHLADVERLLRQHDTAFEKPGLAVQPPLAAFNLSEFYRLRMGVERPRVPETIFQPSLLGEDCAGLIETIEFVLNRYPAEQQAKLVQRLFVTGGNAAYVGMQARLQQELLAIRPFKSSFNVMLAEDPVLNSWHGACDWATRNVENSRVWISRAEYLEKGGHYLKEHEASNMYIPAPSVPQN
uniref:actin-related protein 5-like isoform X2 n=1 Tax=Myxine glutinosa TaxID=7769 RepID=UPI00358F7DBC